MKRVLVLAYYAPPLGMGGTQRVAKFCEYLPEYGWEPVLLTVKEVAYYARDPELSRSLARTRVERTGSLDPQRLLALLCRRSPGPRVQSARQGRMTRLTTSLFLPDPKVGWLPFAVLRGVKLVRSLRAQVVLVTSPPHSAQLAGWLIARLTGVPWVADFRDRWCAGEFQPGATALHRTLDCALEKWTVRQADRIVAVSRGLTDHLSRQGGGKETATIYNGFDAREFNQERRVLQLSGNSFRVTFVGAITDVSWPGTLLEALRLCPKSVKKDLEVAFLGLDLTGRLPSAIASFGLEKLVRLAGYVSHRGAIRALLASHVLYLPVAEDVHASYVPGKLFEYLASLRPILATVPEGETAALLGEAGATRRCTPRDVQCVLDSLQELHRLWKQGKLPSRDATRVQAFERRRQVGQLASLLDGLLQVRG